MPLRSMFPDIWRGEQPLSPGREISRLQRGIDRMFEDFLSPFVGGEVLERGFNPLCDVEETEDRYVLSFDLPGIKKDEVKIEMYDNQLVISGERKHEHKEREGQRRVLERSYGSFQRVFSLPSSVKAEKIEANYHDGVLEVRVPKTEEARPKRIPIKEVASRKAA